MVWGAVGAAAVFAVHPLRVESVAWVTERRDVLSGLFFLLAVLSYLIAVERGAGGGLDSRWRGGSLGLFAAALLSKGSTMMLPAVLLLLDVYPLGRRARGLRALVRREDRVLRAGRRGGGGRAGGVEAGRDGDGVRGLRLRSARSDDAVQPDVLPVEIPVAGGPVADVRVAGAG